MEILNQQMQGLLAYNRVKNPFNYETFPNVGEINTLPSETVPDQTMSMREIIERYARGAEVMGFDSEFDDDDTDVEDEVLPNPKHLDLAERQQMAQNSSQFINEVKRKQKAKGAKNEAVPAASELAPNQPKGGSSE